MLYIPIIITIIESILVVLPILLSVAYVTIAERKTMASMQRRLGPNIVGYYGSLQAFADALKLLLKEYVSPTQANLVVFFLGPIVTLVFSLLSLAVIPFASGLSLSDFNLSVLYLLAVSSLSTYGILLAGWSANSKYAFLGSLRSTAQLISYELILSSIILSIVFLTSSLNLTVIVECQRAVWFIFPLAPAFVVFYIGAVAETNRAPFDLAEAESELVSGFMTEHSSVIFVFFFLAEYASLVVICTLVTLLFLGGYNVNTNFVMFITDLVFDLLFHIFLIIYYIYFIVVGVGDTIMDFFTYLTSSIININDRFLIPPQLENMLNFFHLQYRELDYTNLHKTVVNYSAELELDYQNLISSLVIALKSFIMIFIFIWVRASFPRIRFDQLMTYCWTILLPLVFSFLIILPSALYVFDMTASNALYF